MRRSLGRLAVLLAAATAGATPATAGASAPPSGSERIVGGRAATQAYPFAALLRVDGVQRCGGALVAARYVLTAAHCLKVDGLPATAVEVALGNVVASPGLDYLRAEDWGTHPAHGVKPGHDIAWVRLPFATGREQLRLPRPADAGLWAGGVIARAIGWGMTEDEADGGAPSAELLEVDIPVLADAGCRERLRSWGGPGAESYFHAATMLCAGGGVERDTCDGDSGAPLLVSDGRGFALAGLVSFGLGPDPDHRCAEEPPAFYARAGADALNAWVRSRVPQVEIDVWPARARPDELVRLSVVASGPERYSGFTWDLDGDGAFDDATGPAVARRFVPGLHEVGVRGARGLEAERRRILLPVGVDPPPPSLSAADRPPVLESLARRTRVRGRRFAVRYRLAPGGRVRVAVQQLRTHRTLARGARRHAASGVHRATLRLNRAGRRALRARARRGRALTARLVLAVPGGEDRRVTRLRLLR